MHRLPPAARPVATFVLTVACLTSPLSAQQGGDRTPRGDSLRQAQRLDIDGKHAEARAIFQKLIDTAPEPSAPGEARSTTGAREDHRRRSRRMKHRTLGAQALRVSEIGLGCMGMSEFYGPSSEGESVAT